MNGLLEFSLRQRALVVLIFIGLLGLGAAAFAKLNIEAYPDPVPPLVDVITQNPGQSAEEIERYITIPLEVQLAGLPNVTAIRSVSLFGMSDIKIQFSYAFTFQEAEQRVLNRLAQVTTLPQGVQPQISPTSPTGEVMRYRLTGPPGYSPTDLKTIQDWMLQRRFRAIPGVIDVIGFGGKSKVFEIQVDLDRMRAYGLTLPQLIQSLNSSNANVGGQTLDVGEQSAVVRGIGLIRSLDDVRDTMLTQQGGVPVFVRDIGEVRIGHQPRLGVVGEGEDNDVVEGIVLMRRGEQTTPTLQRIAATIQRLNAGGILPPGVKIEPIYDRKDLLAVTTHTVMHNLVVGVVLVFLVQWLFLGDLRSAVIVSATIPFAFFCAVGILMIRGQSANLLSIGAIDFGLVVDATVIMVENIYRHLAEPRPPGQEGLAGKLDAIAQAGKEVSRAIFFSAAIIVVGFLPLFTMQGVEGHIFGPMAQTYAYAIGGGLIATFTVSPALSAILLPNRVSEEDTFFVRFIRRINEPAIAFAVANKVLTLSFTALLFGAAALAATTLGLEFLPKLEEGNLWVRGTLPASISLEAGNPTVNRIRSVIREYPQVRAVISHQGRPDDGTDPTGFFNAEFFVPLKPFEEWPDGGDKEAFVKALSTRLQAEFPGVEFSYSQAIEDNVAEAVSGIKGQNSIKVFGSDLASLTRTAAQIKSVLAGVEGIADLAVSTSLGQPTVRIDVNRAKAGRYGISPGDINTTVQAAIGGQAAGSVYEPGSDRYFPILVRLAPQYRKSLDAIRQITIGVPNPSGGLTQIPLAEVAKVELVSGAAFIFREGQERYVPIRFSVRGRDLGGAVLEAQEKVAAAVQLPPGYRLEWVGEFNNFTQAIERLKLVVPATLVLIALLLYINFGSMVDTLLALSVIPMAMIGGIFALVLTETPFSISAAIGFIALFGIATMEGVILLSYFNQLIEERGLPRRQAVLVACSVRLRPVMMTCIAACAGLLPAAISTAIGSQVARPLALVVVGGILLAPALVLLVLPALIDLFSRRRLDAPTIEDTYATPALHRERPEAEA